MRNDTGYHAYWNNVKQVALEASDTEPSCSPADYLPEWCDGNWWTINAQAAIATMRHTNNPSAYFDHEDVEDTPPEVLMAANVGTVAHFAFLADVEAEYARIEAEAEGAA